MADDHDNPTDRSQPIIPYARVGATTTPLAAPPAAITTDQMRAINDARALVKPLRKAAAYARFEGWSLAVFGVLTAVCGLSSPVALLLGAGLGVVAYVELTQAKRLATGDVNAPRVMAINQLALAGMLILYALWNLYRGVDPQDMATLRAQVGGNFETLDMIESMSKTVLTLTYTTLIAVAVFVQGGTAWFYYSRKSKAEAFTTQTPNWVKEMISQESR